MVGIWGDSFFTLTTGGETDVVGVGMLAGVLTVGRVTGDGLLLVAFALLGLEGVRAFGLFCCCWICCLHLARRFLNQTWNK